MEVKGWNEFYEGWLARVLLQPNDKEQCFEYREGWRMADETGDNAIAVLQEEIRLRHVLVYPTLKSENGEKQ